MSDLVRPTWPEWAMIRLDPLITVPRAIARELPHVLHEMRNALVAIPNVAHRVKWERTMSRISVTVVNGRNLLNADRQVYDGLLEKLGVRAHLQAHTRTRKRTPAPQAHTRAAHTHACRAACQRSSPWLAGG